MTAHPNDAPPPRLTWPAVCARRLERHGLAVPALRAQPQTIAGAICGAHAQVLSAAELAISLRIPGATRATTRDALWRERTLVKTYGPRGTVHLFPTDELPLWAGALAALPQTGGQLPAGVRLSAEQTDELVAAIGAALAAAELTADELTAALVQRVGPWVAEPVVPAFQGMWPRWRQAMALAAYRGALCFGPNRGRAVTYTSPRRWLPAYQPVEERAALSFLVRRFLFAYGPATAPQLAQWLAAPPRWAAELLASLGAELQEVELEGERAWVVAGDTVAPAAAPPAVRLLPYFDPYVVGSHPRPRLFPGPAARALAGGQAGTFPVVLIDGVVAGVWHQRRAGRRIAVTVELLGELSAAGRADLDEQVERVGAILEGAPSLTFGPIPVGSHA